MRRRDTMFTTAVTIYGDPTKRSVITMSIPDIVVTILLAAAVIAAVVSARRQRKHGGCAGCSGCSSGKSCDAKNKA